MSAQVETRTGPGQHGDGHGDGHGRGPAHRSAGTTAAGLTAGGRRLGATLPRAVAAEWTKLRSLRSTWWVLLITVVLSLGFAALLGSVVADTSSAQPRGGPGAAGLGDPVQVVLGGTGLAALVLGVLGALTASGEYSTGTASATLMAVPRRWPVLVAKALVLVAVVVPLGAALCAGSLWLGGLTLGDAATIDWGASETLRAVAGTIGYLVAVTLLGLGLGFLLRSSAGAITVLVALVFVLPPLLSLVPWAWVVAITDHLPSTAGTSLQSLRGGALSVLAAWWTLAAWAVVPLAAAAVVLRRRDA